MVAFFELLRNLVVFIPNAVIIVANRFHPIVFPAQKELTHSSPSNPETNKNAIELNKPDAVKIETPSLFRRTVNKVYGFLKNHPVACGLGLAAGLGIGGAVYMGAFSSAAGGGLAVNGPCMGSGAFMKSVAELAARGTCAAPGAFMKSVAGLAARGTCAAPGAFMKSVAELAARGTCAAPGAFMKSVAGLAARGTCVAPGAFMKSVAGLAARGTCVAPGAFMKSVAELAARGTCVAPGAFMKSVAELAARGTCAAPGRVSEFITGSFSLKALVMAISAFVAGLFTIRAGRKCCEMLSKDEELSNSTISNKTQMHHRNEETKRTSQPPAAEIEALSTDQPAAEIEALSTDQPAAEIEALSTDQPAAEIEALSTDQPAAVIGELSTEERPALAQQIVRPLQPSKERRVVLYQPTQTTREHALSIAHNIFYYLQAPFRWPNFPAAAPTRIHQSQFPQNAETKRTSQPSTERRVVPYQPTERRVVPYQPTERRVVPYQPTERRVVPYQPTERRVVLYQPTERRVVPYQPTERRVVPYQSAPTTSVFPTVGYGMINTALSMAPNIFYYLQAPFRWPNFPPAAPTRTPQSQFPQNAETKRTSQPPAKRRVQQIVQLLQPGRFPWRFPWRFNYNSMSFIEKICHLNAQRRLIVFHG